MIPVPVGYDGRYTAYVSPEDAWVLAYSWYPKVSKTGKVYAQRSFEGHTYFLHRLIMGLPTTGVDHMNGNSLDCRRGNLRCAGQQLNLRNHTTKATARSPFMGVSRKGKSQRWAAYIGPGGRGNIRHLGYFDTPKAANRARLLAEAELWGIQPTRRVAFVAAGLQHLIGDDD